METITFYSYKGGVGRTLALANIAVYLSRFDQNVCIIDFDLEAPGVPYKLSEFFASPIETGLVDYIYEFTSTGTVPGALHKFLLKARTIPGKPGNIRLFPAGNVLAAEYWKKLASIDWHGLFYKEGGEGIPFFLELKEKIHKELNPDFLLIDSRTGITEMSSICTTILPDKVVFLITNNRENIEGSRQILRGIQKVKRLKNQDPIKVTLALTRIPFPQNNEELEIEQKITEDIKRFLNEEVKNLDEQLNISDILVLHSDRSLELSESLQLDPENITDTPLVKDYLQLLKSTRIEKNIKPFLEE
jgi:MinD-like ATPase involved in chromosome partitioning or flagellar assembly